MDNTEKKQLTPEQALELVEKLTKDNEKLLSLNSTLQDKLENVVKSKELGFDILTHKKKDYRIVGKLFTLPGDPKQYTADELNSNSDLIEKILKIDGQEMLIVLEKGGAE